MFIYGHWRTALIQEQGHPNQVLSLETHPICTSLHIHSHSLSVSRPQSPPALGSLRDSETHWCWSPVQLGLWTEGDIPPGRSPVPPARSQPSHAVLGGLCSVPTGCSQGSSRPWFPITSRIWLQVIAWAASGSPCLVLQMGNKSPRRSSYKVSIHGPPKRKQAQTPNICPGQPPCEGTRGFLFQVQ